MNDKTPNNNQSQNSNNNNGPRKHNNKRRHFHKNHNRNQNGQNANAQQSQNNAEGNKKRPQHAHNRGPRPERPQSTNIEKIYEKYLNLLDQHLIARRKYHDLFFRADPNQKAKLERNFYNTLNEVQEFQNKMTPEVRELFNKRNNGLSEDRIYTENHQIDPIGKLEIENEQDIQDPHYLQSQANCDYSNDTEESNGTIEDYLKYKGL